jgi:hypothetical protein
MTWNRGHKKACFVWSHRIRFSNGANPDVKASGCSEKALTKPSWTSTPCAIRACLVGVAKDAQRERFVAEFRYSG